MTNTDIKLDRDDLTFDAIENDEFWLSQTCEICNDSDPNNDHLALLCDGCDKIYHTFCIDLGHVVPTNPVWFCKDCEHLYHTMDQIKGGEYDINNNDNQTQSTNLSLSQSPSTVIYKDDLSDYDELEELPDDIFTKSNDDEEWVPDQVKKQKHNHNCDRDHDFGIICNEIENKKRCNTNKKKKKSKEPLRKSKRIQSIKDKCIADSDTDCDGDLTLNDWERVKCDKCGQRFNDNGKLDVHKRLYHGIRKGMSEYDCVGDVITNFQDKCKINKTNTKKNNKKKRKLKRKFCNDDVNGNMNEFLNDIGPPNKRRKYVCYNDAHWNDGKHNDNLCSSTFYGDTDKKEGIEIVKNEMGVQIWSFTFTKRKKKKKKSRKKKRRNNG